MELEYYISKLKFQLTGNILESELSDEDYSKIIDYALVELNRYYDATQLIEVPAERCVDLAKIEEENNISIGTVAGLYRTESVGTTAEGMISRDPMVVSAWNMGNSFYRYGQGSFIYNYMAYNTTQQIANTLSTDLDFKEDKLGRKLYVNYSSGNPTKLVIEYIPKLKSVEEIVSDYWIDIISRLSLAYAKIELGRIRTRYTQSDALWTQDGEKLLEEGNTELKELRDRLADKSNFFYPID